MPEIKEVIIAEIIRFVEHHLGDYDEYYIGITNDVEGRIDENSAIILEHRRNGEFTNGNHLYWNECESRDIAVEIEQQFQEQGMEKLNYRSHGVPESRFVYCYKMTEANRRKVLNEQVVTSLDESMKYIMKFKEFVKTLK